MKIGIIGNGFVGKATRQLECNDLEILSYDLNPELCYPIGIKLNDLASCQLVFICVPTPMKDDGSCYLEFVNSVMKNLDEISYTGFRVLRSTVPVGTCNSLGCYFMPEFLTEKRYIEDFINNKDWIFGMKESDDNDKFKSLVENIINIAFTNGKIKNNNVSFLKNCEAEMIKVFRNSFLATKVSFCNEIYEYCQLKRINYSEMIKLAANDDRIGHSHTIVPGHDGSMGFGGTCFPKDISSLNFDMEKQGMKSFIVSAAIKRNNTVDRPEKDWESNKGRSVV